MKTSLLFMAVALPGLTMCSDWPLGEGCTEIGCLSFVRVELQFTSELTQDDVQVVVKHSEKSFTCDFGAEVDPCHRGFQPDFDPVTSSENSFVVLLNDTPKQLRITATAGDETETRLIEPQYERNQPNGTDCDPVCLTASTTAQFSL